MPPKPSLCAHRLLPVVLAGLIQAAGHGAALGQEGATMPAAVTPVSATPNATQELLERMGRLEQRLDLLTRQNENLSRENSALVTKVDAFRNGLNDGQAGITPAGAASPWY